MKGVEVFEYLNRYLKIDLFLTNCIVFAHLREMEASSFCSWSWSALTSRSNYCSRIPCISLCFKTNVFRTGEKWSSNCQRMVYTCTRRSGFYEALISSFHLSDSYVFIHMRFNTSIWSFFFMRENFDKWTAYSFHERHAFFKNNIFNVFEMPFTPMSVGESTNLSKIL
jgi:hypothetical protein